MKWLQCEGHLKCLDCEVRTIQWLLRKTSFKPKGFLKGFMNTWRHVVEKITLCAYLSFSDDASLHLQSKMSKIRGYLNLLVCDKRWRLCGLSPSFISDISRAQRVSGIYLSVGFWAAWKHKNCKPDLVCGQAYHCQNKAVGDYFISADKVSALVIMPLIEQARKPSSGKQLLHAPLSSILYLSVTAQQTSWSLRSMIWILFWIVNPTCSRFGKV